MSNRRLPPSSVTRVGAYELAVLDWIGDQIGLQSRRKTLDAVLIWLSEDPTILKSFKDAVVNGRPNAVGNQTFSEASGMTRSEFTSEVISA